MHSLTEIIYHSTPKYLQYFSKKTGFIVSDFHLSSQANLQWLWRHLAKKYDYQKDLASLTTAEKEKFTLLLKNFGYLSASAVDESANQLEKKIPWIFHHPNNGIFVPLEVIKLLMQEDQLFKENYLFCLLYRMKIKEQKYFASLMGSSLEGQVHLSFESSPLDMALVLYIWLTDHIREITDISSIIPERGKVLRSPFSFARETKADPVKSPRDLSSLIPDKPVPIWDYLYAHFSHLSEDIEKLNTLITRGNKGFYRSVSLLKNQDSDLIKAFKHGILLPILPTPGSGKVVKLVAPVELRYALEMANLQKSPVNQVKT